MKKFIAIIALAMTGGLIVASPAAADDHTNKVTAVTVTVAESGNTYRTVDAVVKVTDSVGNLVKDATYSVVVVNATVSGVNTTNEYGVDTFTVSLPKTAGIVALAVTSNGITVNKLITVTDLATELAAANAALAAEKASHAADNAASAKALADAKAASDKALADAKAASDKVLTDAKVASDKALAESAASIAALKVTIARLYNWIGKLKALVAKLRLG